MKKKKKTKRVFESFILINSLFGKLCRNNCYSIFKTQKVIYFPTVGYLTEFRLVFKKTSNNRNVNNLLESKIYFE